MKNIKILSFVFIFSLFSFLMLAQTTSAQENTQEDPNLSSTELQSDQVSAQDLGLSEDEIKTPDQTGYFWNKLKNNVQIFFTFDQEKKANLEIKKANLELLTAQKISSQNTNETTKQERLQEALEKYKAKMIKVEARIEKLSSERKDKILEKIDEQTLKQQQILRELENKLPEQIKEKITEIRQERIDNWYEQHKNNLEQRLENAADDNLEGSKFKAINTLATLESMSDLLPAEAQVRIQSAITKTQEALQEKLQNINNNDRQKLEDYLKNINLDSLKKVELINKLEQSVPSATILNAVQEIKDAELGKIEIKYKALSDDAKQLFLEKNFANSENVDATKIEILKRLEKNAPAELKIKIQEQAQVQELKIKDRIGEIKNTADLERLQKETKDLPVIRREIEDQKLEILKKEREATREQEKQKLEAVKKQQEIERETLKKKKELEQERLKQQRNN